MPDTKRIEASQRTINESLTAVHDHLKEKKEIDASMRSRLQAVEQVIASGDFHQPSFGGVTSSAAQDIQSSDGFKYFMSGQPKSGQIALQGSLKAALTNPDRGQVGDSGYTTQPNRSTGIVGMPAVKLSLIDVLKSQPIGSATREYITLDGYVNAADYQEKEGDEKAEAELKVVESRAEVQTIAHHLPASLQVLADNKELTNTIALLLSTGCKQKLEHELLMGAGGAGKIHGLVPQAQEYTAISIKPADRIGEAATDLSTAGWNADVIVIHPFDWFAIASQRADSGDGQYVLGSPRDPSPASLWGIGVVQSPSMTRGQALVFDSALVTLLDRQAPTVELSRHDGTNFKRNMVTILAELRAGLEVLAPSSSRLVSLTVE